MKMEELTLEWLQERVFERDGCWIWKGATSADGTNPKCKVNGKSAYVRRVVYQLVRGKPIPSGFVGGVSCDCHLCVHPEHVIAKRPGKDLKGRKQPASVVIKIANTRRANSNIPHEVIQKILEGNESIREATKKYGVSHSYIGALRRGEWRKDFSNPFAGLMP